MKTLNLIVLIICCSTLSTKAQNYSKYLQQGKDFYGKSDYITALERFDLAYEFAKNTLEKNDAKDWKNKSRNKIKQQQDDLSKALYEAKMQTHKADSLLKIAKEAKSEAEVQAKKARESNKSLEKIINAFYFYDDKYALAYNGFRYGFIDKKGNVKIPYKYTKATHFTYESGFSRVTNAVSEYLLDTTGREFLIATSDNLLTDSSEVLDLEINWQKKLPPKTLNYPQLKILLLKLNLITSLPPEIGQLQNLISIDLSYNKIQGFPSEIKNLKNLNQLILRNNELTKLPKNIELIPNLKNLNLSGNYLKDFPHDILKFKDLTELDLSFNEIYDFPMEVKALKKLKRLYIDWGKIDKLPIEVMELNCFSGYDWQNMATIFAINKDYKNAVLVFKKAIEKESTNYNHFYNLSWYALFANQPKLAIDAAIETLELAPAQTGVYTNLALGYLFNNEYEKAKSIYLEWKDKHFFDDKRICKDVFLKDIYDLEDAGIIHKDFEKVKELLK